MDDQKTRRLQQQQPNREVIGTLGYKPKKHSDKVMNDRGAEGRNGN